MKNYLSLLAASATIALVANAYAADSSYKSESKVDRHDDGSYESNVKAESKDSKGKHKTETNVEVDVDDDATEKTVKKEVVDDPKGLFNKQKTTVKEKVKNTKDKTIHERKKVVNGDTVEDSEHEVRH